MLELVYLCIIFLVGFVISYQDIRGGAIRNRMLSLLMLVFLAYFILNFASFFPVLEKFLVNILYTVLASVGLWIFGFWPAGDAKLFIVLGTLLTPTVLMASESALSDMLVNTFVPLFFFYFTLLMARGKRKDKMDSLRAAFSPYRIMIVFIVFVGIAWFISLPLYYLGMLSMFASIVILFIIVEVFYRVTRVNLEYLFIAAAIARLVIDYENVYTVSFAYNVAATVLVFILFRFFFLDLAYKSNTYTVMLSELKPGMRLAEGILKRKDGSFEKRKILHFTIYDALKTGVSDRFLHSVSDEGLSEDDVAKIKNIRKFRELGFNSIKVHVSVPFAVFLFIGFFITVLFGGSFVTFIRSLL